MIRELRFNYEQLFQMKLNKSYCTFCRKKQKELPNLQASDTNVLGHVHTNSLSAIKANDEEERIFSTEPAFCLFLFLPDKVSKLPDPTTPYQTTTTHPPNPTLPTVAPYPHGSVWTPWSNSDSPVYDSGDFEFKFKVSSLSGFCK